MNPIGRAKSPSAVRHFSARLALVMMLLVTATIAGIYLRTQALVEEGVRAQATSYVDLIVTVREWNALHRGVWVTKSADVESNPFLRALGAEPDTDTASGAHLTRRNPAAMTREISELAAKNDMVTFRLTSPDPVNPANAPDEWEAQQLKKFDAGSDDAVTIQRSGSGRVLRLMRPLWAKAECLTCHAVRGAELGDMRGAISVSVSMAAQDAELNRSAFVLALLWLGMVSGGGVVLYSLVYRMASELEKSRAELNVLATMDSLTGLANRRVTLERLCSELTRAGREAHRVGVVIVDIDHFKSINDSYGHAVGDLVLAEVASRMRDAMREYDTLGRVGGEEFVVIAPDVGPHDLAAVAERIRAVVGREAIPVGGGSAVTLTVSAGCALSFEDEKAGEDVLRRADKALYEAKAAGRDRVRMHPEL